MSEYADDDLLRLVTSHADRLPHAAYCLGCHGGEVLHILITHEYGDPTLVHVSARYRIEDLEALARLRRALVAKGIESTIYETNYSGPTRHLRVRLPA